MKKLLVVSLSLFLFILLVETGLISAAEDNNYNQIISRSNSIKWISAAAENFTGQVKIKPLTVPDQATGVLTAYVNFAAGARSNWHIHPNGQQLIVTSGVGWTQQWGQEIQEIRPGDTVWCPPGIKHWHGAAPNSEMTHLVVMKIGSGPSTEWLEKVSEAEYKTSDQSLSAISKSAVTIKQTLNNKEESIAVIAAFTASGELVRLRAALNQGLDAGLTISEIKEILVQLYAYAGFPRSLNALNTFENVLEKRQAQGINDGPGVSATPVLEGKNSLELGTEIQTDLVGRPVKNDFSPVMDKFLKAHLFGDIFGRDILNYQNRELATVSALANMNGVNSQLYAHFFISLNTGITEQKLYSLINTIELRVGKKEADNARELLNRALSQKNS